MLRTTSPFTPAFSAICFKGSVIASRRMSAPLLKSSVPSTKLSSFEALSNATPPPGTIPSSRAALVAAIVSSTLYFFSLSSTSVAAPTLTTATPPVSFASLDLSLFFV